MNRAVIDTGYQPAVRMADIDTSKIDMTALRQLITQRYNAVWDGLDLCTRTCPSARARLCTHAAWFAWPPRKHARSLLDCPLCPGCMQFLLRFRIGVRHYSQMAKPPQSLVTDNV